MTAYLIETKGDPHASFIMGVIGDRSSDSSCGILSPMIDAKAAEVAMRIATKAKYQHPAQPVDLEEALRKIYAHYGPDLLAFFRDAHQSRREEAKAEAQQHDKVRPVAQQR